MKIRETKLHIKDLIKKHHMRYKKLLIFRYNILNTLKIFKFHRKKWSFLKQRKYNRYKKRITSIVDGNSNYTLQSKINVGAINFKYKYFKLLNHKRMLQYYYAVKRFKLLKKAYNTVSVVISERTNRFKIINHVLSLFSYFEKRLDVLLFKIFYLPSLYYSQNYIQNKNVLVNKKLISYFNYTLQVYDLVEIISNRAQIASELYYIINKPFYKPKLINSINYPHLEISYSTLMFLFHMPFENLNDLNHLMHYKVNYGGLQQFFQLK